MLSLLNKWKNKILRGDLGYRSKEKLMGWFNNYLYLGGNRKLIKSFIVSRIDDKSWLIDFLTRHVEHILLKRDNVISGRSFLKMYHVLFVDNDENIVLIDTPFPFGYKSPMSNKYMTGIMTELGAIHTTPIHYYVYDKNLDLKHLFSIYYNYGEIIPLMCVADTDIYKSEPEELTNSPLRIDKELYNKLDIDTFLLYDFRLKEKTDFFPIYIEEEEEYIDLYDKSFRYCSYDPAYVNELIKFYNKHVK